VLSGKEKNLGILEHNTKIAKKVKYPVSTTWPVDNPGDGGTRRRRTGREM